MESTGYTRRVGGWAVALGIGAALANAPIACADAYDLEPLGPGTLLSDTGIPDLFAYGTVTQEIAEYDVTTGQVATGDGAGSLDVTERIFTSPLGGVGFSDGADATDGTGLYADDTGNASAYDLVFYGPFGGVDGYGNIPVSSLDVDLVASSAAAVPADDFGLSSLGSSAPSEVGRKPRKDEHSDVRAMSLSLRK
jgi:hypothetical protein